MAKRRKPDRNPDHGQRLLKRLAERRSSLSAGQDGPPEVFELMNFEVTWDVIPGPEVETLPKATRDRMQALFDLVHRKPKIVLPELRVLVAKHPSVPCLTNWLISALRRGSDAERGEALELCKRLFHEMPGYFFARTTLADLWLDNGEVGKAAELLFGPEAVLTRLYPGRKVFHVSEIRHWAYLCARTKILLGEPDIAKGYRDMLEEMEPDSQAVRHLNEMLGGGNSRFARMMARLRRRSDGADAGE